MLRALAQPTRVNAYILLTLTMLFWAGNYTVGRFVVGAVPPVTLAFLRWTGAAILILPFAIAHIRRDWPAIKSNAFALVMLGVLGSGLFNTLQYIALTSTTATSAGVINASAPAMIAMLSYVVNQERVRAVQVAGILISLAGVLCVLARGDVHALIGLSFNLGDLTMLIATVIWAVYTVLLHRRPAVHVLTFTAVTYVVASVLNAFLAAIEVSTGASVIWTLSSVAAISYTAVFAGFLAYLYFSRGVEIIGSAHAGMFMYLVPFFTVLLAIIFLDEQPALYHAAGLALILSGIWVAVRAG